MTLQAGAPIKRLDILTTFRSRLPYKRDILPVFSVIAFIVFSHSIYVFLYTIPGWLYYMTVSEIVISTAYILVYALFESLIILGCLALLAIILPARYFRDKFVVQASVIIYILTILLLWARKLEIPFLRSRMTLREMIALPIGVAFLSMASIILLSFLFDRFEKLQNPFKFIANQLTIFTYIYIPLSILGLIVVIGRNIF